MRAFKVAVMRRFIARLHEYEDWVGDPTPVWFASQLYLAYVYTFFIKMKEICYAKYSTSRSFTESTEENTA